MSNFNQFSIIWLIFLPGIFFSGSSFSQELEPRSLTNVPVGMNFAVIGYGYAQGNILLDPVVPIEDLDAKLNTVVGAYVRSINIFGLAGKVDVIVPWASGDWTGYYDGIDTSRSVNGFGDARFRLSVNFMGSPALKKAEFTSYKPSRISGLSLQVIAPTGKYDPDKLLNLGSNRWVFRPQWGFSQYLNNWILEAYISAWFFTKNTDFYGGNELRQNMLGAVKLHLIRTFYKKWWVSMGSGYAIGGKTYINDDERDVRISTLRFGLTLAIPVAQHHTFRLTGVSGVRLEQGSDFNALGFAYQYRWIGKK